MSIGGVSTKGSRARVTQRWSLASAHIPSVLMALPLPSPLGSCTFEPVPFALQPSVGQVARVDVSSKVEVVWADNSKTIILPQVSPCRAHLAAPDRGSRAGSSDLPGQGVCFGGGRSQGKERQCYTQSPGVRESGKQRGSLQLDCQSCVDFLRPPRSAWIPIHCAKKTQVASFKKQSLHTNTSRKTFTVQGEKADGF